MNVLQLYDSTNAFAILEAYLRDHGFFRPSHDSSRRADVYLGFGLSAQLRRSEHAATTEPCALPLLACRLRSASQPPRPAGRFSVGTWTTTWSAPEYETAIELAQAAIGRGDVYQVNLVQHLSAPFEGDSAGMAAALAPLRPRVPQPMLGPDWSIVSASPELFLSRRGSRIWTMPIKGTRPPGRCPHARTLGQGAGRAHDDRRPRAQ